MSDAPVVWAITDSYGRIIGAVFEHHEDAIIDCKMRNETIRAHHADIHGNCCSVQAFAFIPNTLR